MLSSILVWHCLPGQEAWTQNAVSEKIPSQSSPPCKGVGDVQLRLLVLFAVPHVALHAPYSLQEDQPPLTIKTGKNWDLHYVVVTLSWGFCVISSIMMFTWAWTWSTSCGFWELTIAIPSTSWRGWWGASPCSWFGPCSTGHRTWCIITPFRPGSINCKLKFLQISIRLSLES